MYSDGSPAATLLEQASAKDVSNFSSEIKITDVEYETMIRDVLGEKEERIVEHIRNSIFTTSISHEKAKSEIEEMTLENTSENSNAIVNFDSDTFDSNDQKVLGEEALKTVYQQACRDLDQDMQIKLEGDGEGPLKYRHESVKLPTIEDKKAKLLGLMDDFLFIDFLNNIP
ncbi:hypothetical protein U1Q18_047253 [Sarracenia purpurea var. burkii]